MARRNAVSVTRLVGAIALTVALLSGSQAIATGIDITTSNDILGDNPVEDDLYTASLAIDFKFRLHSLQFRENIFTDRDAGLRFDETSLSVELATRDLGGWKLHPRVGALQVGSGLLGEEVQNSLHDLIGSREVDLDYPADNEHFALVNLSFERPTPAGARLFLIPTLELDSAPRFKSHLKASMRSRLTLSRSLQLFNELGYRVTESDHTILAPHIREDDLVYDVTLGMFRTVYLSYSHNRFGVGQRHLRLYLRFDPAGRR